MAQTTKEKMEVTSKLCLKKDDIKRIAEHPTRLNFSLLQTDDGANFVVEKPFDDLSAMVRNG